MEIDQNDVASRMYIFFLTKRSIRSLQMYASHLYQGGGLIPFLITGRVGLKCQIITSSFIQVTLQKRTQGTDQNDHQELAPEGVFAKSN